MKGKIYIEKDFLVLNVRFPYEIHLSRLDTPEKAHQWIIHLLEKNWVTRELLFSFVCTLEQHFGYSLQADLL